MFTAKNNLAEQANVQREACEHHDDALSIRSPKARDQRTDRLADMFGGFRRVIDEVVLSRRTIGNGWHGIGRALAASGWIHPGGAGQRRLTRTSSPLS